MRRRCGKEVTQKVEKRCRDRSPSRVSLEDRHVDPLLPLLHHRLLLSHHQSMPERCGATGGCRILAPSAAINRPPQQSGRRFLFLFLLSSFSSSSSSSSCHCSSFRIFSFCFKMRFLARLLEWQHVLPTSLAACLQQGFCGSILTPRHVLRGLHTAIFRSRDMESLGHGFLSILCKFKHFSCVLLYEGENRRRRLLQAVVQLQEEESNLLLQLRQQQSHSQQLQQRWFMLLLVKGFRLLQLLRNPLFTK
jgi:hypothetical protein